MYLSLDPAFTDILYLEVNYTDHIIFVCVIYKHLYQYTWSYILKILVKKITYFSSSSRRNFSIVHLFYYRVISLFFFSPPISLLHTSLKWVKTKHIFGRICHTQFSDQFPYSWKHKLVSRSLNCPFFFFLYIVFFCQQSHEHDLCSSFFSLRSSLKLKISKTERTKQSLKRYNN